ncbi:hypothetical protein RRG08_005213 [Elysia crispata]|uniref:Uncharacterized protein n=1 Tax=Elysia crispata TaxID=231223 RepID=A0AAE1B4U7_9GAST|nr:hypothetical protein RRG08_005213 [Elysia crispata]
MGLMLGYSFKGVVIVGWTLSTATALFMVFGMYDSYSHTHLTTVLGAAIYNALKDAGFTAWLWLGSSSLASPATEAFILVSRVTYCMYLVHIPILFYFAFTNDLGFTVWWTGVLSEYLIGVQIQSAPSLFSDLQGDQLARPAVGIHCSRHHHLPHHRGSEFAGTETDSHQTGLPCLGLDLDNGWLMRAAEKEAKFSGNAVHSEKMLSVARYGG